MRLLFRLTSRFNGQIKDFVPDLAENELPVSRKCRYYVPASGNMRASVLLLLRIVFNMCGSVVELFGRVFDLRGVIRCLPDRGF